MPSESHTLVSSCNRGYTKHIPSPIRMPISAKLFDSQKSWQPHTGQWAFIQGNSSYRRRPQSLAVTVTVIFYVVAEGHPIEDFNSQFLRRKWSPTTSLWSVGGNYLFHRINFNAPPHHRSTVAAAGNECWKEFPNKRPPFKFPYSEDIPPFQQATEVGFVPSLIRIEWTVNFIGPSHSRELSHTHSLTPAIRPPIAYLLVLYPQIDEESI